MNLRTICGLFWVISFFAICAQAAETRAGKPSGGWTLVMCVDFQGRTYDLLPAVLETDSYGDWAFIQNGEWRTYNSDYGQIGYELNLSYSFFKYSCSQLNQWCQNVYGEDYAFAKAYQPGTAKAFPFLVPSGVNGQPAQVCGSD